VVEWQINGHDDTGDRQIVKKFKGGEYDTLVIVPASTAEILTVSAGDPSVTKNTGGGGFFGPGTGCPVRRQQQKA
jgi:hypothetical protein